MIMCKWLQVLREYWVLTERGIRYGGVRIVTLSISSHEQTP